MAKLSVVILNWNGRHHLERFLPSVVCHSSNEAEVVVADNGSKDDSLAWLRLNYPEVRVVKLDKNYGFADGYNRAIREVESEYVLLLNSDVEVTDGWLAPLVEVLDNEEDVAVVAPKLRSVEQRDRFEYAGAAGGYIDRFGYPFCRGRIMKRLETDRGQYDTVENVFWATGACLMVRSSVYRKLGGLDDRFFAHMEEIDLCWRMQLEGWKVTVVPQSVVYHVGGGTLPATSPYKLYLNYRNNLLMLQNNLAKTYALEACKKGHSFKDAANIALKKAGRKLCARKCLDALSAAVYLLTLKKSYFKSVRKAHKDYKALRTDISKNDLIVYLDRHCRYASIAGIYRKSIILHSFLKKDRIFEYVKAEDFKNI